MRALRLRVSEWLVGASLVFLLGVYAWTDSWNRMRIFQSQTPYHPLLIVLLTVVVFHATRIDVILLRKLGASFKARPAGSELDPRGFSEELAAGRKAAGFLRDFAPLSVMIFLYPASEFVVTVLRGRTQVDDALIQVELALFGGHLSAWMERLITPGLTDLMSFCYVFHTMIPVLVLSFLCLFRERAESVEAFEGFVTIFLIGLVLYVVVPATGPMQSIAASYSRDLTGGMVTDLSREAIAATRVPRDAFPSLHVGISALMLVYAWRTSRWFGLLLLPVVVGNWVSTVYLRYHYVIDLVAGFALVPVSYQIAKWGRHRNGLDPIPGTGPQEASTTAEV